jgi:hypothetical protein
MIFHLPVLLLRPSKGTNDADEGERNDTFKPSRKETDLSFLRFGRFSSQEECQYSIYEAKFSFVICGSDNTRYNAYVFVDGALESQTEIDAGNENGNENNNEAENSDDDDDFQDDLENYNADPVTAWGGRLTDQVIRDPREYFLWVVQTRMEQALREYQNLVKTFDHGITEHVCCHLLSQHLVSKILQEIRYPSPLTRPAAPDQRRKENLRETYDWTMLTLARLGYCLKVVSFLVKTWDQFNAENGDIKYFVNEPAWSAESAHRCGLSLHSIHYSFNQLEGLQKELRDLEKACDVSLKDVSNCYFVHSGASSLDFIQL